MLPKLARLGRIFPKEVTNAPCQEIVLKDDEVDLTKIPVLTCWPEDGGPFVTLPLVFTHHPETGKRNVGMYRLQVYDARTTGHALARAQGRGPALPGGGAPGRAAAGGGGHRAPTRP